MYVTLLHSACNCYYGTVLCRHSFYLSDSSLSEGWSEGKLGKKKKRKMKPDSSLLSENSGDSNVQLKKKVKRRISSSSSGMNIYERLNTYKYIYTSIYM